MILAHCRNTVNTNLFPQRADALRLWDGGTRWALLNPAAGQFVWDKLDTHLAAAEAAGLKSIYTIGSTPAWAAQTMTGQAGIIDPTSNRPPDPMALFAFIDALISRYGSRIWAIETWNEWNAPGFWIGSVNQLAELQYLVYSRVKQRQPSIIVTTPTPCYAPRCQYPTADVAMAAFVATGMPYDVATFHGYVAATAPPTDVSLIIAALRSNLPAGTKLWDTEFGPAPSMASLTTADSQRLGAMDALITRYQQRLDLACWYQWDNQTHGACVDLQGNVTPFGQACLNVRSLIAS